MPGFDGTGPAGQGPLTGGGRGFCAVPAGNVGARGYGQNVVYGLGRGGLPRGCGRGFGGGRRFATAPNANMPAANPANYRELLQRLDNLEAENAQLRAKLQEKQEDGK